MFVVFDDDIDDIDDGNDNDFGIIVERNASMFRTKSTAKSIKNIRRLRIFLLLTNHFTVTTPLNPDPS